MTHPTPEDHPPQIDTDSLVDSARLCLWALAFHALAAKGKKAALDALEGMRAGTAHLTFAVEVQGDRTMIVGQLSHDGALTPLVVASLATTVDPDRRAVH